jgi:hypothetical protein
MPSGQAREKKALRGKHVTSSEEAKSEEADATYHPEGISMIC